MKNLIIKAIYKILFNYKKPKYSGFFYNLANKYVDFYEGNGNGDMELNGESRVLKELVFKKEIKVVFDVGANIGDWTEKLTKLDKYAEVYCFEPVKETFEELRKRFSYKKKIRVENLALGEVAGKGSSFYKNPEHSGLGSFYDMREKNNGVYKNVQPIPVTISTLDDYCSKHSIAHIDLLKIDVEGHELSVLKGATKMLGKGGIDFIQFEYGLAGKYARLFFKDFIEFFDQFGYDIYKIKPLENEKIVYNPLLEHTIYANFIAVKKGI